MFFHFLVEKLFNAKKNLKNKKWFQGLLLLLENCYMMLPKEKATLNKIIFTENQRHTNWSVNFLNKYTDINKIYDILKTTSNKCKFLKHKLYVNKQIATIQIYTKILKIKIWI